MKGMSCKTKVLGLTLIELMVTLVIVVVTISVAAPGMQRLICGNRLRTETDRLLVAINLARSEAVNRNTPVSLCPSTMASSGEDSCSGSLADGWIVFTNQDRDGVVDAGTDQVIRAFAAIPRGYSLTNLAGTRAVTEAITYLPDGSSRRNRTLLLCPHAGHRVAPWRVVLNLVGRARVARGSPAGAVGGQAQCPATLT